MIKLDDNEKLIIQRGKSFLQNNDIRGFCNFAKDWDPDKLGRISQFLMEQGIDLFNYFETIPDYLFRNSELESIVIPDNITVIGRGAFYGCKNLEKVKIGNSVTTIRDAAFQNCTNLKRVILPDSVRILGKEVFTEGNPNIVILANKRTGNKLKCKQSEIPWYKDHLYVNPGEEE